jgi:dTDP-4-dehydrorhamnose 3,5-epimerase
MEVILTKIPGIIVFKPRCYDDDRGRFYELWRYNDYREAGINELFLQDNFSRSSKNVLRGLHFQIGEKAQGQLVSIISGKVFDVCVDIRKDSPSFGQHIVFELVDSVPQQIYMPPGIAHGFCVLSENAILHYKCTQYYSPENEGGILWNDLDLNIPWPVKDPIISKKDASFLSFKDLKV